jgi:TRAP-type C4-dicarboxylate transport system permease small subunit
MIWMVMFGAALVQSKNEHIRIDFFPMLAGARVRRFMEILFRLATLTFLAIIAYKGFKISYFNRMFESSGLRISMFWPTLAIPLGAIAIGCYTISGLIRDICQLVSWTSTELQDFDRRQALEKYHPDSEDGSKPHRQER